MSTIISEEQKLIMTNIVQYIKTRTVSQLANNYIDDLYQKALSGNILDIEVFISFSLTYLTDFQDVVSLFRIIYNNENIEQIIQDYKTNNRFYIFGYAKLASCLLLLKVEYDELEKKYEKVKEEKENLQAEIDFAPGGVGMRKAEKEFEGLRGKKMEKIKKRRNSF